MVFIVSQVSFIGDGWKKRFEWQTIEELDDLPTLDKYLHTAKLDLPKSECDYSICSHFIYIVEIIGYSRVITYSIIDYASMMKKTKKVVDDDDIFAAD